LSETNQTYQNTVIQLEKENNQLESNQEKERIQFQESLDQINRKKKELKSTTLELEQRLNDEKRVSQELSTQIDLLTENETKMKAQHQQDQQSFKKVIQELKDEATTLSKDNKQLKDELQTAESEYLELQLEVEQLTETNQTYQNTVIQLEKENNELIGKNNQLKSNQEKER
ncbi:hypothetical protein P4646_09555, partial [Peribacillus simplex]|uniref:hypothetical protein n=1 Tax=Peribacillus simplex TaxID=1478 RepID=UPI002E240A00|nr:hypothetical protein [Peribacillus simplex]